MTRKNLNLKLFEKAYLIRRAEEKIIEVYDSNEMKTPMHMSMGEEAIVSGVASALSGLDLLFGTYRSHGLYLARSGDTFRFFSEMFGRESGVVRGKGGSMHLSDPDRGLVATSAVVASTIPVAVGSAYALKKKGTRGVSAVFFGDGAIDEGSFWESLNMASLFKLPVLFVCEDNGFAVHTPPALRHGYKSISAIVSRFNCSVFSSTSTDAEVVFNLASRAKNAIFAKQTPAFIYLKYYRYLEHVGTHEDFSAGYRSQEEYQKWLKVDPLKILASKLKKLGVGKGELDKICKDIDLAVERSFKKARNSAFPNPAELYKNVFHEK
ncbi:MAG: thiamine pyrophosphate-dependent dehydrogenase E1 component subunit alpha [Candidatus Curtissbacteria bacterium]|nr:thiamine pyrophosphate-dependent dehydrogenase E1 component subunit alpha [Candidatus Curtissbacteria bacterium]